MRLMKTQSGVVTDRNNNRRLLEENVFKGSNVFKSMSMSSMSKISYQHQEDSSEQRNFFTGTPAQLRFLSSNYDALKFRRSLTSSNETTNTTSTTTISSSKKAGSILVKHPTLDMGIYILVFVYIFKK